MPWWSVAIGAPAASAGTHRRAGSAPPPAGPPGLPGRRPASGGPRAPDPPRRATASRRPGSGRQAGHQRVQVRFDAPGEGLALGVGQGFAGGDAGAGAGPCAMQQSGRRGREGAGSLCYSPAAIGGYVAETWQTMKNSVGPFWRQFCGWPPRPAATRRRADPARQGRRAQRRPQPAGAAPTPADRPPPRSLPEYWALSAQLARPATSTPAHPRLPRAPARQPGWPSACAANGCAALGKRASGTPWPPSLPTMEQPSRTSSATTSRPASASATPRPSTTPPAVVLAGRHAGELRPGAAGPGPRGAGQPRRDLDRVRRLMEAKRIRRRPAVAWLPADQQPAAPPIWTAPAQPPSTWPRPPAGELLRPAAPAASWP